MQLRTIQMPFRFIPKGIFSGMGKRRCFRRKCAMRKVFSLSSDFYGWENQIGGNTNVFDAQ